MKKSYLFIFTITTIFLFVASLQAQTSTGYMDIAQKGMGGRYITFSTGDASMANTNAALMLVDRRFHLTLLSIQMGFRDEIMDLVDFVSENSEQLGDFESLTPEEQADILDGIEPFDDQWQDIFIAPLFGVTLPGIHVGFGVFGNTSSALKIDRGVFVPAVGMRTTGYTGGYFSVAREMYNIKFGATGRFYGISDARIRVAASDVSDMGSVAEKGLDQLEDFKQGFGIDIAAIHQPIPNLDVAVKFEDLIGSFDGESKGINLITGAAYYVPFDFGALDKPVVVMDINDWFNREGDNFFKRINLGTQIRILKLFRLRGGFHQGYPTFGAGLNLGIVRLDYANFATEETRYPGGSEVRSHQVGLTIGF